MSKDDMSLASLGSSFLEICFALYQFTLLRSINMKVCEFFCERRNGMDWIGLDWRVAIIMCHCLLKCLAQSVESKPNETMGVGFGCRLLIRPGQKTFLWTNQKVD
jgi:hypothetical protein